MSLKKLRKIVVYNRLNHGIADLSVVYHESNKSLKNWYNLGSVNVETRKNILWSRCTRFSNDEKTIPPFTTVEEKAGHVCFGQNSGYWQVYFTDLYTGVEFKLQRNNCKMTLPQECHKQDLKIELIHDGAGKCSDVKVKFQICSTSAEFRAVKGKPTSRTMKVLIQNQTERIFAISSFTIIERVGNAPEIASSEAFRQEAIFDGNILVAHGVAISNEIPYDCFDRKHCVELFLVSDGNCYEMQEKKQREVSITLSEKDYGSIIAVDLIMKLSNPQEVFVKIKTSRNEKCYKAEMTGTVSDRNEEIKEVVEKLRRVPLENKTNELIHKFQKLAIKIRKERLFVDAEHDFSETNFKLLQRTEFNSDREELLVDGQKFSVTGDVIDFQKSFQKAVMAFNQFKDMRKSVGESLLKLVHLIQTLNERKNCDLNLVLHDSKIVGSMCMSDALCTIFTLTGFDDNGLTFSTSELQQTDEVSICPVKLAEILKRELMLWKCSVFGDGRSELGTQVHHTICRESLARFEEVFSHVKLNLINDLRRIAGELHLHNKNVNISMLASYSIGIVGATLTVAGIAVAPLTAGASLPLLAVGLAIGAASGAVGAGTTIADGVLTTKFLRSTISLAVNYVHIHDRMKVLLEEEQQQQHRRSNTVAKAGAQAAVGLVFDLTGLVVRSVNLSKGAVSELGCKLEAEASMLENECF